MEAHAATGQLPTRETLRTWPVSAMAQVLTCLLEQAVSAEQVQARAVGLGLLRWPAVGLPLRSAARLLLAGYQLPALVERGSWPRLGEHLRAGCRLFVLLPGAGDLVVHRLCSVREAAGLAPAPPVAPERVFLPLSVFRQQWSAAGHGLVAGAASWQALPAEGRRFFGGTRDLDGSYYWDSAECATDGAGRILRF